MRWPGVLVLMLVPPLAAHGAPLPDGGVTAPEVAAALTKSGYPADIATDRSGEPTIRSSTGKVLFKVRFYQCDKDLRCASIQFTAPFRHKGTSQAAIAEWDRDHRFGRAALDARGTAWVSMDVETSRGMTTEALEANIDRWISVLNGFQTLASQ